MFATCFLRARGITELWRSTGNHLCELTHSGPTIRLRGNPGDGKTTALAIFYIANGKKAEFLSKHEPEGVLSAVRFLESLPIVTPKKEGCAWSGGVD